jgi:hypothetical protein
MIDVAVGTYKYTGSLELEAQRLFGLTPTRYWQEINRLIDTQAALAYRPTAVASLRARRGSRVSARVRSRMLS